MLTRREFNTRLGALSLVLASGFTIDACQPKCDIIDAGNKAPPPTDIYDAGNSALPPTDVIDANC